MLWLTQVRVIHYKTQRSLQANALTHSGKIDLLWDLELVAYKFMFKTHALTPSGKINSLRDSE